MAQEIGSYYVSLMPSGRGFEKAAQGQAESAFKGAEKTSTGFFSGLVKWAKRGALVVAGMVGTIGALAITGGVSRALNIEDATAKLKGLGHDTKSVTQIMNDALASVKGTAFGLDKAATTAASAVAAGIKPGQELERYLRLTADAATIAGVSMEEMGGIINQVTSKGYAGMENLNRLTERGIPILQWLQDEYGVTADELAKMVSRGEVDAETFRKVIEDNIGGAALASGDTTRGAFANMMAALSRLGESFVGDALGGAKTFFVEVTEILDGINQRLKPWVEAIQEKLGGMFELEGFGGKFLDALDRFVGNFDSSPLGILFDSLKPLIPVFREIGERVGPVLADTFRQIGDALAPMVPLLADTLVDAVAQLAPPFTDLLIALLPILPALAELTANLLPVLTELLLLIIPPLSDFVSNLALLVDNVTGAFDAMSGDTSFEDFGRQVVEAGGPLGDFGAMLLEFLESVWPVLGPLLELWTEAWNGMLSILGAVVAEAMPIITQLHDFWSGVWSRMSGVVQTASNVMQAAAQALWQMLPEEFRAGVDRAVAFVSELPGKARGALGNVGSALVQSGKALIRGFVDGIKSMIGEVGSAVSGVLDFAAGFFPHSPAKRGPFSGAGWWAVADGGAALMEQFASGAELAPPSFSFDGFSAQINASGGGVSAESIGAAVAVAMRDYPQIMMPVYNPVTRDPFDDLESASQLAGLR